MKRSSANRRTNNCYNDHTVRKRKIDGRRETGKGIAKKRNALTNTQLLREEESINALQVKRGARERFQKENGKE